MTPDEVKFRRCQVPGCDYKEVRGSRQGDFVHGRFVCPSHAMQARLPVTVYEESGTISEEAWDKLANWPERPK